MSLTRGLNKAGLLLRIAERAVLIQQGSDGKAAPLDSQPDADRLNRALHDGIDEFFNSHPWSWADRTLEVTLSPDGTGALCVGKSPCQYALPTWMRSVPKGKPAWQYAAGSGGAEDIQIMPAAYVRRQVFLFPETTGSPVFIGTEWASQDSGDRGGMILHVYPKPDQAYRLLFEARVTQPPLMSDEQYPIWPAEHDLTVVEFGAVALLQSDLDFTDPTSVRKLQTATALKAAALARSIETDAREYAQTTRPSQSARAGYGRRGTPWKIEDRVYGNVLAQGVSYR